MATLQSKLMTDDNHHIHVITNGATSFRRKSAFTLSRKGPGSFLDMKRYSLQLAPTLKGTCEKTREITLEGTRETEGSSEWTSNVMPEFNKIGPAVSYPQELNPAASLLHSVSMHSRHYLPNGQS